MGNKIAEYSQPSFLMIYLYTERSIHHLLGEISSSCPYSPWYVGIAKVCLHVYCANCDDDGASRFHAGVQPNVTSPRVTVGLAL